MIPRSAHASLSVDQSDVNVRSKLGETRGKKIIFLLRVVHVFSIFNLFANVESGGHLCGAAQR